MGGIAGRRLFVPLGFLVLLAATNSAVAEPPMIVEEALRAAAERTGPPGVRLSFNRTITMDGVTVTVRYAPEGAADGSWALLTPQVEQTPSPDLLRVLEGLSGGVAADRSVLFDWSDPNETVVRMLQGDGFEPVTENDEIAVFSFKPLMPPGTGDAQDTIRGEVTVRKNPPEITALRLYATGSFSPAPGAQIDRFEAAYRFGEIEPGGPIVVLTDEQSSAGRSPSGTYQRVTKIENFDFALVDAAPQAAPE